MGDNEGNDKPSTLKVTKETLLRFNDVRSAYSRKRGEKVNADVFVNVLLNEFKGESSERVIQAFRHNPDFE
jgi:hypothetical protein|tara:strand:+ start:132 stop:344 length:213 start_codon:yes stop_codon:yes gene_type:complete